MGTRHRAGEIFVWLLVAIYAVASLLPSFAPRALSLDVQLGLVVFLPLAFALIHGALRHGIAASWSSRFSASSSATRSRISAC